MNDPPTVLEIQSEGRVFSQKNSEKLQSLFLEIGELLVNSGVVDNETLKGLLDENNNGIPDGLEEPSDDDEEYEGEEYEDENEEDEEDYSEDEDYEDDYESDYSSEYYDEEDEYDSEINASARESFTDQVARLSWFDKLGHALKLFEQNFVMMHEFPGDDRLNIDTESLGLIQDLSTILNDLHHSYPTPQIMPISRPISVLAEASEMENDFSDISEENDSVDDGYFSNIPEEIDSVDDGYFSNTPEEIDSVDDGLSDTPDEYNTNEYDEEPDSYDEPEVDTGIEQDDWSYQENEENIADIPVNASARVGEGEGINSDLLLEEEIKVSFDCNCLNDNGLLIAAQSNSPENIDNRHPFEGILFKIDQPSEASPSIGPSLPLYIPSNVAQLAVNTVNGLPLDAHESLRQHSNQDITGVILSAQIKDDDFIVKGYLWPWSKPNKVEQIAANARDLGMSMNAIAKGRKAEQNGRQVFFVENLKLLGANILYSDRATFRQTRVSAAADSSNEELMSEVIAASSNEKTGENEMDYELRDHLNSFNETLSSLKYLIQAQNEQVAELEARLESIEDERNERYEQVSAAAAAEEREQQEIRLTELINAAVRKAVNPSGSPNRITTSLAASSAMMTKEKGMNSLMIELESEKRALEKLREGGGNQKARLAMRQRITELEAMIAQGNY